MVSENLIYNVDPFYGNRLLDVKVFFLNVFSFYKKLFSIKSFKTGILTYFNNDLGKVLIMTEGIIKILAELDKQQAKKVYPSSEKALKHFIKIYHSLEKMKFFDNEIMEETCSAILRNLYKTESRLRHIAYDDIHENNNEDKRLNEVATLISINSVL